jgi:transcriptional regulator GlxA family with amidase domain
MVIGCERATFVSRSGAVLKAHHTFRTAPALDTIIIPGGELSPDSEACAQMTAWLQTRAKTTRRVATIAAGIYPLAATGLLNGRPVTTHWRIANEVARTFPALRVETAASFIKSEKFYTCGGGIAGMEMSLALIEDDCGPRAASIVARELSVDLRPPADEQQVAPSPYDPGPSERLAELPGWITRRLQRDLTVEVLAERACLSQRHFYRLFKETFKSTPEAFVEKLRLLEAQRRLAAQRETIESVAASVGFKSPAVFRRAFSRQHGVPPGSFRKHHPASPTLHERGALN